MYLTLDVHSFSGRPGIRIHLIPDRYVAPRLVFHLGCDIAAHCVFHLDSAGILWSFTVPTPGERPHAVRASSAR